MSKPWMIIACASLFLVAGCLGTDVGNPADDLVVNEQDADGTITLTARVVGLQGQAPGVDNPRRPDVGGVQIEEAWIALDRARFCTIDGRCKSVKIGPAALNLLTGEVLPERMNALSRSGLYETIEFEYAVSPAAGMRSGVDALRDAALYVKGRDPRGREFTISDSRGGALSFTPQAGLALRKGQNLFAFRLKPSLWISGAALSEARPEDLRISRTSNMPLFGYFERAFQTSTALVYDREAKGSLSDEDFERPVAFGE